MKNKYVDSMLKTLRKHSPDRIDRIRRYINKLEKHLWEEIKMEEAIAVRIYYSDGDAYTERHELNLPDDAVDVQEIQVLIDGEWILFTRREDSRGRD